MKVVLVTGTDTGVGKTVVSAALATLALADGLRVTYVKPVQTGLVAGEPGDADDVRRLAGLADVHEFVRLPDPLAPDVAAEHAGVALPTMAAVAARIGSLTDRDLLLVEGAGGLLVRLDGEGGTLADLALALGGAVVVVARAGLGTLNATALTCEALRTRGVPCLGVVVGAAPAAETAGLAERSNLSSLPRYAGVPLLGGAPDGLGALGHDAFAAAARAHLAPGFRVMWRSDVDG